MVLLYHWQGVYGRKVVYQIWLCSRNWLVAGWPLILCWGQNKFPFIASTSCQLWYLYYNYNNTLIGINSSCNRLALTSIWCVLVVGYGALWSSCQANNGWYNHDCHWALMRTVEVCSDMEWLINVWYTTMKAFIATSTNGWPCFGIPGCFRWKSGFLDLAGFKSCLPSEIPGTLMGPKKADHGMGRLYHLIYTPKKATETTSNNGWSC